MIETIKTSIIFFSGHFLPLQKL